jgi:hypothetical protein
MKSNYILFFLLVLVANFFSNKKGHFIKKSEVRNTNKQLINFDTTIPSIHVLVALCDNTYQGIVPVPAKIGNGQDPNNNLYWGCGYGVRTFFKKSQYWVFLKATRIDSIRMERIVFKHKTKNVYLVADAYNGKYIKNCTIDFFKSCAGQFKDTLHVKEKIIGINGNSKLIAYIGHDGLMDFDLSDTYKNSDVKIRQTIMLACVSKRFFAPHLKMTKANPLVWSTGLMSPEAYTLHDAIIAYINNKSAETVRISAAKAYHQYQRCGEKAAMRLLVSGY